MKLDEKRKVIEVLLCSASSRVDSVFTVAIYSGEPKGIATQAMRFRRRAYSDMHCDLAYHYAQSATEAAYRLIESSPTLRREWFGAP